MSFADTAPLVALLKLDDKFSGPLKNAQRTLGQFDANLTKTSTRAFRAGEQIGTGIKNGLKIAAVGLGLLATQVLVGLRQLVDLEDATTATNAALLSTKGVSGQTAQGVRALAEQYENLNAIIDDKVIQSGENVLLTFTNIRKEAFEPALAAALDLSVAMKQDLQTSIVEVGKALNDPARGFAALRRVGIQFTADQEKEIVALQKSGNLLGAQKVILKELGTEFGGRFAAQGKTAKAAVAGIGDAVEDLQKGLATALFPTVQRLLPQFRNVLASPQFAAAVSNLGDKIADLFSDANIQEGTRALSGLFKAAQTAAPIIQNAAEVTGRVVKTAVDLFRSLPPELQALAVGGLAINKLTGGLVTNVAGGLIGAIKDIIVHQRGATPANPVFVVDVTGGAGVPGAAGAGALATGAAFITGAALVVALKESGVVSEIKHGFDELIFGKERADEIARFELGLGKAGTPAQIAAARAARDSVDARGDRRLRELVGPPTTVPRNAIAALAGAMTGAARATKAFTSAAFLAGRTLDELRAQEKAARGKQFRIAFAASGKPSETLPVVDYLVRGFTISQAPFYRNMDNAKRALEAIKADQRRAIRQGDTVTAGILGQRIRELEGVIKRSKTTVNVTVPVTTTINGRIIGSALTRFTTSVGNLGLTTGNLGGAVGGN